MKDLTPTVAKNLSSLRKARGITQGELAEKFNYSDKAISKWERGESLPDLNVLQELADFYGVTLDYLTHIQAPSSLASAGSRNPEAEKVNRILFLSLTITIILTIATIIAVGLYFKNNELPFWVAFVWATPLI